MAYKRRDDHHENHEGAVTGFKDGQPVYKRGGNTYRGRNERGEAEKGGYRGKNERTDGGQEPQRYHSERTRSYGSGEKPYRGKNEHGFGDKAEKPYENDRKPYSRSQEEQQPNTRNDRPQRRYGQDKERQPEDKPYRRGQNHGAPAETENTEGRRSYPRRSDRFTEAPREAEPAQQPLREDELPYILMGRNAVKEALKSGRSIDRILVQKEPDGSLRELIGLARDRNLQIREVERAKLDELCMPFGHGNKTGNHQGIVAQVPGVQYCEIADILDAAAQRGEKPFVVILDGIEDPYNLGSILRSAECAGAHGVIIPKRRAAGVTSSACKASAGAVEYIKVAQVSNLTGAIGRLKDAGLWIAGADMAGEPMQKKDFSGAIGLVIGSEGKGISKLVKENCDFLVSIPMFGRIDSLNASVAAAILLYEKARLKVD